MTSPASLPTDKTTTESGRRFAPLGHYIRWTVRRYGWLLAVGLCIFSFMSFLLLIDYSSRAGSFYLIHPDSDLPMRITATLFGWLAAYVLFGYLWNRRESGAYGSIGVSRGKQFFVRYGVGMAIVALSVILPLGVSYALDMQDVATDPYGVCLHYTLVYTLSLLMLGWLSFTMSTVVAGLCGRRVTALLCGAGFLAAPYSLSLAAQMLVRTYLLGSPLGAWGSPYADEFPNLMTLVGENIGLFTVLSDETASMFLCPNEDEASAILMKELRPFPGALLSALFILIVALCALAYLMMVRRRAERAGQVYVHPVVAYVTALAVGLGAGAPLLLIPFGGSRTLSRVLGAVAFVVTLLVVTLLLVWALTREWRGVVRSLPMAGGAAAVVVLTVVCLSTGGFGYATTIPATDEIASVTVSYNQNRMPYDTFVHGSSSSGGMWQGPTEVDSVSVKHYHAHYYSAFETKWSFLPTMTSPEDIEVVRRVHKAIIDEGLCTRVSGTAAMYSDNVVRANYCISYTLKSGKVITRYYENLSLRALEATLAIDDTDTLQGMMQSVHAETTLDPSQGLVLTDPLFSKQTLLELSDEEKAALLAALDADYADLSVEERYFPKADEVLGTIYLSQIITSEIGGESGGESEIAPVIANVDHYSEIYYITAAYTRTLALLEARDLTKHMTASYTVKAVLVQPCTPREQGNNAITFLFRSFPNINELDGKRVYDVASLPETEWNETIAASVPTAMITRSGRMIFIVLANAEGKEMAVTRFVPDEPRAEAQE